MLRHISVQLTRANEYNKGVKLLRVNSTIAGFLLRLWKPVLKTFSRRTGQAFICFNSARTLCRSIMWSKRQTSCIFPLTRDKVLAKKKDKMETFFLIKLLELLYRNNYLHQEWLILTSYWPDVRAVLGDIGRGRGSINNDWGPIFSSYG